MYTSDQSITYSNSRALGYGQAEQCTQVSVLILKTCLTTKMWNGWPGLAWDELGPRVGLPVRERRTRNRVIRFCKVQWSNHAEEEATWEHEDELKAAHPDLFASSSESRGRDSV